MNADLKNQLAEMGSEYEEVVGWLLAVPQPARHPFAWAWHPLLAASVAIVLGLTACFVGGRGVGREAVAAHAGRAYRLAGLGNDASLREIIATQRADGGWQNDFLTRQNAAALRTCDWPEAKVAYKKAMRNLKFRGLLASCERHSHFTRF